MRGKGIDYFENSRRATYAQRGYAIANPNDWDGYGANGFGLSASDGPRDVTLTVRGRPRLFFESTVRNVRAKPPKIGWRLNLMNEALPSVRSVKISFFGEMRPSMWVRTSMSVVHGRSDRNSTSGAAGAG